MLGYEDKTLYRTLQNKLWKSMLVYYYYRFLKILIMLLLKILIDVCRNKTKHHGKKYFRRYCLQCFSSSKVLECYSKNCLAINRKKSVFQEKVHT